MNPILGILKREINATIKDNGSFENEIITYSSHMCFIWVSDLCRMHMFMIDIL